MKTHVIKNKTETRGKGGGVRTVTDDIGRLLAQDLLVSLPERGAPPSIDDGVTGAVHVARAISLQRSKQHINNCSCSPRNMTTKIRTT